jgi:hypothetical protein
MFATTRALARRSIDRVQSKSVRTARAGIASCFQVGRNAGHSFAFVGAFLKGRLPPYAIFDDPFVARGVSRWCGTGQPERVTYSCVVPTRIAAKILAASRDGRLTAFEHSIETAGTSQFDDVINGHAHDAGDVRDARNIHRTAVIAQRHQYTGLHASAQ